MIGLIVSAENWFLVGRASAGSILANCQGRVGRTVPPSWRRFSRHRPMCCRCRVEDVTATLLLFSCIPFEILQAGEQSAVKGSLDTRYRARKPSKQATSTCKALDNDILHALRH